METRCQGYFLNLELGHERIRVDSRGLTCIVLGSRSTISGLREQKVDLQLRERSKGDSRDRDADQLQMWTLGTI